MNWKLYLSKLKKIKIKTHTLVYAKSILNYEKKIIINAKKSKQSCVWETCLFITCKTYKTWEL